MMCVTLFCHAESADAEHCFKKSAIQLIVKDILYQKYSFTEDRATERYRKFLLGQPLYSNKSIVF